MVRFAYLARVCSYIFVLGSCINNKIIKPMMVAAVLVVCHRIVMYVVSVLSAGCVTFDDYSRLKPRSPWMPDTEIDHSRIWGDSQALPLPECMGTPEMQRPPHGRLPHLSIPIGPQRTLYLTHT